MLVILNTLPMFYISNIFRNYDWLYIIGFIMYLATYKFVQYCACLPTSTKWCEILYSNINYINEFANDKQRIGYFLSLRFYEFWCCVGNVTYVSGVIIAWWLSHIWLDEIEFNYLASGKNAGLPELPRMYHLFIIILDL